VDRLIPASRRREQEVECPAGSNLVERLAAPRRPPRPRSNPAARDVACEVANDVAVLDDLRVRRWLGDRGLRASSDQGQSQPRAARSRRSCRGRSRLDLQTSARSPHHVDEGETEARSLGIPAWFVKTGSSASDLVAASSIPLSPRAGKTLSPETVVARDRERCHRSAFASSAFSARLSTTCLQL